MTTLPADMLVERVLYQDSVILVINKPAGIPVHGGPGGGPNLEQYFEALRFGISSLPGLAHRLDRDTSGCLILGRHPKAMSKLGKMFMAKRITKSYWAIVKGCPAEMEGHIDLPLSKQINDKTRWWMKADPLGLPSITDYKVMGQANGMAWLELYPRTGRTHQLRVHCASLGCPIVGDKVYGDEDGTILHLHARSITIPLHHDRPPIIVDAPPPPHMLDALTSCGML